jgi:regulator of protease activity HflC (stomatin/prohibitin superfamily)
MSLIDRYVTTKKTTGRNGYPDREEQVVNGGKVILDGVIAVAVLIAALIVWPFNSVPTGSRGVVTQFGKIERIEGEGLAILPPWQKLTYFSIRAETATINKADGGTSDQQPVSTSLVVRYSIQPDKVAEVFEKYSHDGDLSSYVNSATHETFKAVTAKFTAPDLLNKRAEVSKDVRDLLQLKLDQYGAQVINVDMTEFAYDPGYQKTINDKVKQDQLLQTAEKQLKTVESEQKQKVAVAEADASAVKAKADGDFYAKIKAAESEAKSLEIQNEALAKNKDVLELRRIEVEQTKANRWNGQLPQNIYAGAPIPFLNVAK